jgi:hypothetical protein
MQLYSSTYQKRCDITLFSNLSLYLIRTIQFLLQDVSVMSLNAPTYMCVMLIKDTHYCVWALQKHLVKQTHNICSLYKICRLLWDMWPQLWLVVYSPYNSTTRFFKLNFPYLMNSSLCCDDALGWFSKMQIQLCNRSCKVKAQLTPIKFVSF